MAKALSQNRTVKVLLLCNNGISNDGALALALALSNNSVRTLQLRGNKFGSATVSDFAQSLLYNHAIRKLVLWARGGKNYPQASLGPSQVLCSHECAPNSS